MMGELIFNLVALAVLAVFFCGGGGHRQENQAAAEGGKE